MPERPRDEAFQRGGRRSAGGASIAGGTTGRGKHGILDKQRDQRAAVPPRECGGPPERAGRCARKIYAADDRSPSHIVLTKLASSFAASAGNARARTPTGPGHRAGSISRRRPRNFRTSSAPSTTPVRHAASRDTEGRDEAGLT